MNIFAEGSGYNLPQNRVGSLFAPLSLLGIFNVQNIDKMSGNNKSTSNRLGARIQWMLCVPGAKMYLRGELWLEPWMDEQHPSRIHAAGSAGVQNGTKPVARTAECGIDTTVAVGAGRSTKSSNRVRIATHRAESQPLNGKAPPIL